MTICQILRALENGKKRLGGHKLGKIAFMQNLMPYCTLHQTIYRTKVISQKNHSARYQENWTSNFKCYAFLKNHG